MVRLSGAPQQKYNMKFNQPTTSTGGGGSISGSILNEQIARGVATNTIGGSNSHTFDGSDYYIKGLNYDGQFNVAYYDKLPAFNATTMRKNQVKKVLNETNAEVDYRYPSQYDWELVMLMDTDYDVDSIASNTDNGKFFLMFDLTQSRTIKLPGAPNTPVDGATYRIGYVDTTSGLPITIEGNGSNIIGYNLIGSSIQTNTPFSTVELFYDHGVWIVVDLQGEWSYLPTRPLLFDTPSRSVVAGQGAVISANSTTVLYTPIVGADPSGSGNIDLCQTPLPQSIVETIRFNVYNNSSTVDLLVFLVINGIITDTITILPGVTGVTSEYLGRSVSVNDLVCIGVTSADSSGTGSARLGVVNTTLIVKSS